MKRLALPGRTGTASRSARTPSARSRCSPAARRSEIRRLPRSANVLTAEQRTRFDARQKEMGERRAKMKSERGRRGPGKARPAAGTIG